MRKVLSARCNGLARCSAILFISGFVAGVVADRLLSAALRSPREAMVAELEARLESGAIAMGSSLAVVYSVGHPSVAWQPEALPDFLLLRYHGSLQSVEIYAKDGVIFAGRFTSEPASIWGTRDHWYFCNPVLLREYCLIAGGP